MSQPLNDPSPEDAANRKLKPSVPGDVHHFDSAGVPVCAIVSQHGTDGGLPPLVLIHSVNATASSAEMRALHTWAQASRSVVSIDLPGFGLSGRPDVRYTPGRMALAIRHALKWVGTHVGTEPPDIVSLSLTCEFTTLAVVDRGVRVRSLAFISPTGAEAGRRGERWAGGQTRAIEPLRRALRWAPIGGSLFRLLTTRWAMRSFLSRSWGTPNFDPVLLSYGRRSAQQPGAQHAPLDFVAGALFSKGIVERYAELGVPVWVAHGIKGSFTDYCALDPLLARSDRSWQRTVFDTGAMPHAEATADFTRAYTNFLGRLSTGAAVHPSPSWNVRAEPSPRAGLAAAMPR